MTKARLYFQTPLGYPALEILSRHLTIGVSPELRSELRIGDVSLGIISVGVKGETTWRDEITQGVNIAREKTQSNDMNTGVATFKGVKREQMYVPIH